MKSIHHELEKTSSSSLLEWVTFTHVIHRVNADMFITFPQKRREMLNNIRLFIAVSAT